MNFFSQVTCYSITKIRGIFLQIAISEKQAVEIWKTIIYRSHSFIHSLSLSMPSSCRKMAKAFVWIEDSVPSLNTNC